MGAWMRDLSLKYKFWAVNAVSFLTTLLLVLYAMQLEQQTAVSAAKRAAQEQAQLLARWPAEQALPSDEHLLTFAKGATPTRAGTAELANAKGWVDLEGEVVATEEPLIGAEVVDLANGQRLAVLAHSPSLLQVFEQRAFSYAVVVCVLMLALLAASQLLIHFLLVHLNTLKDVMLQVEKVVI